LECCWTKKISRIYIPQEPTVINIGGVTSEVQAGSEWQEFIKYEGNLVRAVSPYRWFPDTRFSLTDFQRGEFCASEEEYSKTLLKDLEESGEVAGIEFVQPLPRSLDKSRGGPTRTQSGILSGTSGNNLVTGPAFRQGKMEGTVSSLRWCGSCRSISSVRSKPLGGGPRDISVVCER
jgi:hypothetical protein